MTRARKSYAFQPSFRRVLETPRIRLRGDAVTPGSGLRFAERGTHALKGIPDE